VNCFGDTRNLNSDADFERVTPLGLQLTADRGQEATVLRTAVRVQRMLGSGPG